MRMYKKDMLEYYKQSYYHEFDHRDKINSRVAIPLGIFPVLGAADIYLINHINEIDIYWKVIAIVLVSLFSLALLSSVFYMFSTLYNHKYGYVATPKQVYEYQKLLEQDGYTEQIIEEELDEYLSLQFSMYSTLNFNSNISKVFYLRLVYYSLVLALVMGLCCVPIFTFAKNDTMPVTKVELIQGNGEE